MQNEEVLKIKDVAALLKVGEKTVYSMAQSGELPAFRFAVNGGSLRRTLTSGSNNRKQALRIWEATNEKIHKPLPMEA